MLIRDQDTYIPNMMRLLNEMTYLDEEQTYDPYLVTIRYNDRFGQDLIKLEEFCEFAQVNQIDDAGVAIHEVCKANNISTDNIGFYMDEAKAYADPILLETAQQLYSNGYHICVAPVPKTSVWYQSLTEALLLDEDQPDYDSSPHCQIFAMDYALAENVFENISNKVGSTKDSLIQGAKNKIDAGKEFASDTKESIAKRYSAAKQKVKELANKVANATGDAKAVLLRQLSKAKAVAKSLKDKLVAAPGKGVDAVKSGAGFVKNKVSGGVDAIGNGITSAKRKVFG